MDETPADAPAEPQAPMPPHYLCPACGATVEGPAAAGPVLTCPDCGTQFFLPTPEDPAEHVPEAEADDLPDEAELSIARIRQMSMLTRTAYRTRSYFIIGALACLGTSAEIISLVVKDVLARHHWGIQAIGGVFLAMAGLIGASKFFKRAVATHREIQAHLRARELEELEAAKHEPDLSALSDGSHHARNLESMLGGKERSGE